MMCWQPLLPRVRLSRIGTKFNKSTRRKQEIIGRKFNKSTRRVNPALNHFDREQDADDLARSDVLATYPPQGATESNWNEVQQINKEKEENNR